jgi:hypothetical protein
MHTYALIALRRKVGEEAVESTLEYGRDLISHGRLLIPVCVRTWYLMSVCMCVCVVGLADAMAHKSVWGLAGVALYMHVFFFFFCLLILVF